MSKSSHPPDSSKPNSSVPAEAGNSVFAPGGQRLQSRQMKALSPNDIALGHREMAGLVKSLIMMVDDEPLNIDMTQAFLEEAGYLNFVSTHESEKAVEMLRAKRPNVLLLDLTMPKVGGMEILAQLRADAALKHTPVIILTSLTDSAVKLKALGLGAMDFLSKPVDPSELALRLRNTLVASAYQDFLAHHDPLTGLANRARYRDAVEDALVKAAIDGDTGALLHVGVDRLAPINDALGRGAGDSLLQRLARRLRHCVDTEGGSELGYGDRPGPTIYRFDGDEFAVLVPHVEDMETTAGFINKLLEASAISFNRAPGQEMFVTCSIGVTVFPNDGSQADALMSNASVAMRAAKASGRHTYEFFSADHGERATRSLGTGADLRRAITKDELTLLYQPKIDVMTGALMGAEAVIRWNDPRGTVIEGEEVMELAGTSEIGMVLADWMLDQVRQHVQAWRKSGTKLVPIGMDFSLKQFPLVQLADLVRQAIRAGLPPAQLCLELQESSILDVDDDEAKVLGRLKQLGLRVALDHFGAGHSSLGQLSRIPIDEVKLAPAFMYRIEENKAGSAMVTGVMALARSLGMTFVAMGVQSVEQLAFLKSVRCDQCQGRLFKAAMAPNDFAAKWLERDARPAS